MSGILTAVIIVGIIGLVCGIALAIASIVLAVPVDEKAEAITEMLPGANCGACGFSGCAGYAAALSKGETTDTALCNPGGNEVSKQIAEYLGLSAGEIEPMTAVVMCQGIYANATTKMEYKGVQSCKMASQLFGGPKDCVHGCLGLGDCMRECPYGAIQICDGVARVSPAICKACKKCIAACPKNLIELVPYDQTQAVQCASQDKGQIVKKGCQVGCIGCTLCTKVCESGAITVENNLAHIDPEKCTNCGKCMEKCPVKIIRAQ